MLFFSSYYWITPESPRWLLSKNRIDEAEVIVQKMAKVNKKQIPANFLRQLQVSFIVLGLKDCFKHLLHAKLALSKRNSKVYEQSICNNSNILS